MSGSLVQLVSQGIQDVHLLTGNLANSIFTARYKKHTPFSQNAKQLEIVGNIAPGGTSEVEIVKSGDIVNHMWLEGENLLDYMAGTEFELYMGGKLIDTQSFEYITEIWPIYLAETKVKSTCLNNRISSTDKNFFPLHFFFCDNGMFLPLVGMQYHKVEIRIKWGPVAPVGVKVYGNYIFLDTPERTKFAESNMDMLITQVQSTQHTATDNTSTKLDISTINHPVKAMWFGQPALSGAVASDFFTFDNLSMYLNGQVKVDTMSPHYFHTVQGYYHTQNALVNFTNIEKTPFYTRFFMYSFADDASEYNPTGSCNFSRLDTAILNISNISRAAAKQNLPIYVYALNYNILRVREGLTGILFSN
tara:strand:- start:2025 stop:3110 length:1086 start_codon:yes stop_codon:yes gene_type:complete